MIKDVNGLVCYSTTECESKQTPRLSYVEQEYIDGCDKDDVLGYDCDGSPIEEFRMLRFPFSSDIDDWSKEPNVDPRFYCLVRSLSGEVYAISVYDDWCRDCIRKYERLGMNDPVSTLLKTVQDMTFYEVAFDGITKREWYYDRNRDEMRNELERLLKGQKGFSKTIQKK